MKIVYPKGAIQLIGIGDTRGSFALWCNGDVVYSFQGLCHPEGGAKVECMASGICPIDGLTDFVKGDIWYQLSGAPTDLHDSHFLVFRTPKFTIEWEIYWQVYRESFPSYHQQLLARH